MESEREALLKEANDAYARIRSDPDAWDEELKERQIWDGTLMDGLRDDPYFR